MDLNTLSIMTKYVKSMEALPSSLHIWDPTPTQTAIEETKVLDVYPTSSIDSSDTISFIIPALEKYMLDKVDIVTELRVLTATNENPNAGVNVSTAPHLAASLWRNVNVTIGNVGMCQSFDNSYAMFKFWDTVLHNRSGSHAILADKEGLRLDWVHSKDHSENLVFFPADANTPPVNANGQLRANKIQQGRKRLLISPFDISIFNQDKLLPTNLEIRVSLTKNPSEFILMSAATDTSKVKLDKVALRCTFQKPTQVVLSLIEERLAKENAIYHADRKIMSLHPITAGATEVVIDNFLTGTLPYQVVIGVQDRAALGADRTKNPYTLYPMKSVQLFVNGREHFSVPVEQTVHDKGLMYNAFLEQTGFMNQGDTLLEHYWDAYPAMAFDLTPDASQNQHGLNLVKSGTARLVLGFENAVGPNQVLMALAWYEQIMEVDVERQVHLI